MKSTLFAVAALFALVMTQPVHAQDDDAPEAPTSPDQCVMEGEAPAMPDPKTATEEEREAAFDAIKEYQKALKTYRECLVAIMDNQELDVEVRKAAQNKFNASVDAETAVVEAWVAFNTAYKERKKKEDGGGE